MAYTLNLDGAVTLCSAEQAYDLLTRGYTLRHCNAKFFNNIVPDAHAVNKRRTIGCPYFCPRYWSVLPYLDK